MDPAVGGGGPDVVEEVAKAPDRAVRGHGGQREFRPRRDRTPEGVKAPDPSRDAVEGIVFAELKCVLERRPVDAAESARVRAERLRRVARQGSPTVEVEGRDREAFAPPDQSPGELVAVAPRATRARVEEHADDGKLDRAPGALRAEESGGAGDGVPAAGSARPFEVTPPAVQGYPEVRVALAGDLRHELRRGVEPGRIDREVLERPALPEIEQLVRPLPNRLHGPELPDGGVVNDVQVPVLFLTVRPIRCRAANRRFREHSRQAEPGACACVGGPPATAGRIFGSVREGNRPPGRDPTASRGVRTRPEIGYFPALRTLGGPVRTGWGATRGGRPGRARAPAGAPAGA